MEALFSRAARQNAWARRRRGCRSRSSRSRASRSRSTPSGGSSRPGVYACDRRLPRRAGGGVRRPRSAGSAPRSRRSVSRSRSGEAAASVSRHRSGARTATCFALNGDELLDVDFRALLAEHERDGRCRDDRGRAGAFAVRRRRARDGRPRDGLPRGAAPRRLGQLPASTSLGEEALERLPGARRPRA